MRKIIFHFPFGGKIIFLGKRNIIFPDNTKKIKFQRDFFGKSIFSGSSEKENVVFCAVLEEIDINEPETEQTISSVLSLIGSMKSQNTKMKMETL